jgi:hypothetical protein
MLDHSAGTFEVAAFDKPFQRPAAAFRSFEGQTVAQIIAQSGIEKTLVLGLKVRITLGARSSEVALADWGKVRPRAGCMVEIYPQVEGVLVAGLLTSLIGAAAPSLAAFLFPALGEVGLALVSAGISIVGQLLVSALIPPPSVQNQPNNDPTFAITGASNAIDRYGVFPSVLGRRRYFPKVTGQGFTEVVGTDVYFTVRLCFGHGPVALEEIRVGETSLEEFDDWELEFLNIDQAETERLMPWLNIGDLIISSASSPHGTVEITGPTSMRFTQNDGFSGRATVNYTLSNNENYSRTLTVAQPRYTTNPNSGGEADFNDRFILIEDPPRNIEVTLNGGTVVGWRQGEEAMSLYSTDIDEVSYNAVLQTNEEVVRQTSGAVLVAQLDTSFQSLYAISGSSRVASSVIVNFSYRKVGETVWVDAGTENYSANTTSFVRFTKEITFPEEAEHEIRITRTNGSNGSGADTAILTAIRSVGTATLPSHEGISEIAIRIRASDQLNGRLQTVNAIVQQMGYEWDGAAWSGLVPINHPAWILAQVLRGPYLRDPVPDNRIQLADLKAWADDEPHWECGEVIDGDTTIRETARMVCAAGRAKFGLVDLLWGVVRDNSDGPVVQTFTPLNSYDFRGSRIFSRPLDALRVNVISEDDDWQRVQIVTYADGRDETNATYVETLDTRGVVLRSGEGDQGNAWRHGRLAIADARLRPEEYSWGSDLDHVRCQNGDKVRIVHDVPLAGIGYGFVREFSATGAFIDEITLDNDVPIEVGKTYRMRVRRRNGEEVTFSATKGTGNEWTPDTQVLSSTTHVGDMAVIEETTVESLEVLITSIVGEGDLQARLTAVPAAPGILQATSGAIPPYISPISAPAARRGPTPPRVIAVFSDRDTAIEEADMSLTPAAEVSFELSAGTGPQPSQIELQWRAVGGNAQWQRSGYSSPEIGTISTGGLLQGEVYELRLAAMNELGEVTLIQAGQVRANSADTPPLQILDWVGEPGVGQIRLSGTYPQERDIARVDVFARMGGNDDHTLIGSTTDPYFVYQMQKGDGGVYPYDRFAVMAVDFAGQNGPLSDDIEVLPRMVFVDRENIQEGSVSRTFYDVRGSSVVIIGEQSGVQFSSITQIAFSEYRFGDDGIFPQNPASFTVGFELRNDFSQASDVLVTLQLRDGDGGPWLDLDNFSQTATPNTVQFVNRIIVDSGSELDVWNYSEFRLVADTTGQPLGAVDLRRVTVKIEQFNI